MKRTFSLPLKVGLGLAALSLIVWAALRGFAQEEIWAETLATITVGEAAKENGYDYTLTYEAPESIAVNADGQPVKGPIHQMGISKQEPLTPQTLRLRYRRDEPILFQLVDEIKYKN